MQTSDNMSAPHDVHFDDTLAATRGRSNYYFSFATWPIGVGTPRDRLPFPAELSLYIGLCPHFASARSLFGRHVTSLLSPWLPDASVSQGSVGVGE